ncbi:MAG: glycosyltransferase family 2 protein [Deltaproteobacteria bacterium]|nr:glycosyltransferase family 2 protein [Deltaproteobacteria bacterium]
MERAVYIIIVTHDSADVLPTCLEHLSAQSSPPTSIIIVDSGSPDSRYLDSFADRAGTTLVRSDNMGFSRANNLGYKEIAGREGIVVFLNPDTFLPPDYIAQAIDILEENHAAAIVSGKLLGFDIEKGAATGKIDSTGIFRKWYGRWYDRGKGEDDSNRYNSAEEIPAVCGALMICRMDSLQKYNCEVFDSDFFLYKEDIELSLRLRRDGWKLLYDPRLVAFHCRGWQNKRKKMGFSLRLTAAENELLLYRKNPSPYVLWALLKYISVAVFRL